MLPEIVCLAKAENALFGNADFLVPDFESIIVINIDGRIETIGVDANPLGRGQEFPAPVNSFTLEVVTEGEVTQHLEVGAVTCGLADVLNVAGTNALLAGGDAMTRQLCSPVKKGFIGAIPELMSRRDASFCGISEKLGRRR